MKISKKLLVVFCTCAVILVGLWVFKLFKKDEFRSPVISPVSQNLKIKPITCLEEDLSYESLIKTGERETIAASLKEKTDLISNKLHQFDPGQNQLDALAELQQLLVSRKRIFLEAIYKNPDAALANAFSSADSKILLAMSNNCVESPVLVEGELSVIHLDYQDPRYNSYVYEFVGSDGVKINLYPTRVLEDELITQGMKIRVRGWRLDKNIIFNSQNNSSDQGGGYDIISQRPVSLRSDKAYKNFFYYFFPSAKAQGYGLSGNIRIAAKVIICPGVTSPRLTVNGVRDMLFGNAPNQTVKQFWEENSYGEITITGDVYEVVQSGPTCQTIVDPVIDFTQYDHMIIYGKNVSPGNTCGYSYVGGFTQYINDVCASSYSITSHELGHGFGLWHSGGYGTEYGNFLSVMGFGQGHVPVSDKKRLGWLDGSRLVEVSSPGQFTIKPYETSPDELKAIGSPPGGFPISVEYRQPIGMDANIPASSGIFNGGALHRWSTIFDPTPPEDPNSSALLPGQTYRDTNTGFQVTALSADASGLVVDILPGKTDFIAPTVNITSPADNAMVSGTIIISATAIDQETGVEKVEFFDGYNVNPINVDLTPPYEASLDTTTIPDGIAFINVGAHDRSGQVYGAPNNIGWDSVPVIVLNNIDTTPPSVNVVTPIDGDTLSGYIRTGIDATDNVGLSKITVLANNQWAGEFIFNNTQTQITNFGIWWDTQVFPDGQYDIQVAVQDFSGNTTTTSPIRVTIDNTLPQCSDYMDNDSDGFTDFPVDPDCSDINDDSEALVTPSPTVSPPSPSPTSTVTPTVSPTSTPTPSQTLTPTPTVSLTPIPTATPVEQPPVGALELVDCFGISGWTFDPDSSSSSIQVKLYRDGPMNSGGVLLDSKITNILRNDINSIYGITGWHGYRFITPLALRDGNPHDIYVYGINTNSFGSDTLLLGSPVMLNCSVQTPTPSGSVSPSPTPSSSQSPTPSNTTFPSPSVTQSPSGSPPPGPQATNNVFENFTLWKIPKILSGLGCYAIQLAVILFGIWIVISGIKFFLSRGNSTEYGGAKKAFAFVLLGGLIIFSVYTIIMTVAALFGYGNLSWVPICS